MKTPKELTELAALSLGLNVGTEEWSYNDLKWFEPLQEDAHMQMLIKGLDLKVEYPKYKGFGTTCGKHTVFRDDLGQQNRLAVVLEAADRFMNGSNP